MTETIALHPVEMYLDLDTRPAMKWPELVGNTEDFLDPDNELPCNGIYHLGINNFSIDVQTYGPDIDRSKAQDLKKFVRIVEEHFGDYASEILQKIVIAPFSKERSNAGGCVIQGSDGVILVNSANFSYGYPQPEGSDSFFLIVLMHEFGHLMHGLKDDDVKGLVNFARQVGWNMDGLIDENPNWATLDDNYLSGWAASFSPKNTEGITVRADRPWIALGHPIETFAELTRTALLKPENLTVTAMQAWLGHIAVRTGLDETPKSAEQLRGAARRRGKRVEA